MKRSTLLTYLTVCVSFSLLLYACRKDGQDVSMVSTISGTASHNNGANCMTCHRSSGKAAGAGWFVAAGSCFMPDKQSINPNAIIYLYTGQNATGDLKAKINVDALGNFYTTEPIDFGNGLYPAIQSASGNVQYMTQVTRTGACNGCHGASTDRLWVN